MDKESRRLIVEILSILLLLVIAIPICVHASDEYRSKKDFITIGNKACVNISNNGEYKEIKVTSGVDRTVKMNLVMKISKFNDEYLITLDDNVYNLRDLEYTEDDNYRYYRLGSFDVDNERVFNFKIKVKDKAYYDETISYSFYTEGSM